jgi:hypothetical protein
MIGDQYLDTKIRPKLHHNIAGDLLWNALVNIQTEMVAGAEIRPN